MRKTDIATIDFLNNIPEDATDFFVAGDLSATNVLIGVYTNTRRGIQPITEGTYNGQKVQDFNTQVLADLIAYSGVPVDRITRKVFSPAGPISPDKRTCKVTNAPFSLEADVKTALINDYAAIAYAIARLGAQLKHIFLKHSDGSLEKAVDKMKIGIHGAGTGFGTSRLVMFGKSGEELYTPIDSEGGHKFLAVDEFDEEEVAIKKWLYKFTGGRIPHVEAVLSGRGIQNVFDYFISHEIMTGKCVGIREILRGLADSEDAAAYIAQRAKQDKGIFWDAMRFFWKIYGRCLHDLAVHENARGGIWVAGGIIRKNIETYPGSGQADRDIEKIMMEEFDSGPTHTDWVNKIPVRVILDKRVGLEGAISVASTTEYFERERYKG
ncbi:hypothetical protein FJZ19_04720 [Candidatus Pacearchaeota archaeon]|nr:hypothetical protein [Candidatus Pacearchaeota archaeon]